MESSGGPRFATRSPDETAVSCQELAGPLLKGQLYTDITFLRSKPGPIPTTWDYNLKNLFSLLGIKQEVLPNVDYEDFKSGTLSEIFIPITTIPAPSKDAMKELNNFIVVNKINPLVNLSDFASGKIRDFICESTRPMDKKEFNAYKKEFEKVGIYLTLLPNSTIKVASKFGKFLEGLAQDGILVIVTPDAIQIQNALYMPRSMPEEVKQKLLAALSTAQTYLQKGDLNGAAYIHAIFLKTVENYRKRDYLEVAEQDSELFSWTLQTNPSVKRDFEKIFGIPFKEEMTMQELMYSRIALARENFSQEESLLLQALDAFSKGNTKKGISLSNSADIYYVKAVGYFMDVQILYSAVQQYIYSKNADSALWDFARDSLGFEESGSGASRIWKFGGIHGEDSLAERKVATALRQVEESEAEANKLIFNNAFYTIAQRRFMTDFPPNGREHEAIQAQGLALSNTKALMSAKQQREETLELMLRVDTFENAYLGRLMVQYKSTVDAALTEKNNPLIPEFQKGIIRHYRSEMVKQLQELYNSNPEFYGQFITITRSGTIVDATINFDAIRAKYDPSTVFVNTGAEESDLNRKDKIIKLLAIVYDNYFIAYHLLWGYALDDLEKQYNSNGITKEQFEEEVKILYAGVLLTLPRFGQTFRDASFGTAMEMREVEQRMAAKQTQIPFVWKQVLRGGWKPGDVISGREPRDLEIVKKDSKSATVRYLDDGSQETIPLGAIQYRAVSRPVSKEEAKGENLAQELHIGYERFLDTMAKHGATLFDTMIAGIREKAAFVDSAIQGEGNDLTWRTNPNEYTTHEQELMKNILSTEEGINPARCKAVVDEQARRIQMRMSRDHSVLSDPFGSSDEQIFDLNNQNIYDLRVLQVRVDAAYAVTWRTRHLEYKEKVEKTGKRDLDYERQLYENARTTFALFGEINKDVPEPVEVSRTVASQFGARTIKTHESWEASDYAEYKRTVERVGGAYALPPVKYVSGDLRSVLDAASAFQVGTAEALVGYVGYIHYKQLYDSVGTAGKIALSTGKFWTDYGSDILNIATVVSLMFAQPEGAAASQAAKEATKKGVKYLIAKYSERILGETGYNATREVLGRVLRGYALGGRVGLALSIPQIASGITLYYSHSSPEEFKVGRDAIRMAVGTMAPSFIPIKGFGKRVPIYDAAFVTAMFVGATGYNLAYYFSVPKPPLSEMIKGIEDMGSEERNKSLKASTVFFTKTDFEDRIHELDHRIAKITGKETKNLMALRDDLKKISTERIGVIPETMEVTSLGTDIIFGAIGVVGVTGYGVTFVRGLKGYAVAYGSLEGLGFYAFLQSEPLLSWTIEGTMKSIAEQEYERMKAQPTVPIPVRIARPTRPKHEVYLDVTEIYTKDELALTMGMDFLEPEILRGLINEGVLVRNSGGVTTYKFAEGINAEELFIEGLKQVIAKRDYSAEANILNAKTNEEFYTALATFILEPKNENYLTQLFGEDRYQQLTASATLYLEK